MTEEKARQQAVEASMVTSLLALPTQTWSGIVESRGTAWAEEEEECAMCMEAFGQEDKVKVRARLLSALSSLPATSPAPAPSPGAPVQALLPRQVHQRVVSLSTSKLV